MQAALEAQIQRVLEIPKLPEHSDTHHCRLHMEPWVFQTLRDTYLPPLKAWWPSYTLPTPGNGTNALIVYETRKDPMLEFLVYNLCYFARGWALHIYCSAENLDFVKEILGHNVANAHIEVVRPHQGEYTSEREQYNRTLISKPFWESLHMAGYTHVLLAELDSYLRRDLGGIVGIEEYDYIASRWEWSPEAPGGGGLSVRRVATMLELCDSMEPMEAQDTWVAQGLQQRQTSRWCTLFAESSFVKNVLGVHQWWSFLYPYDATLALPIYTEYMTLEIEDTDPQCV